MRTWYEVRFDWLYELDTGITSEYPQEIGKWKSDNLGEAARLLDELKAGELTPKLLHFLDLYWDMKRLPDVLHGIYKVTEEKVV